MIDTITIYSSAFQVRSQNRLKIIRKKDEKRNLFFYLSDGRPVIGSIVEQYSPELGIRVRFSPCVPYQSTIFTTFEPLKVLQLDSSDSLDLESFQQAFIRVHGYLRSIGVEVQFNSFKLCRLDLYRDILCETPPEIITGLFKKYYKKPRKLSFHFYENHNFEVRGRNSGFEMYDRVKKCHDRKQKVPEVPRNMFLLRFELRLKNHQKVNSELNRYGIKDFVEFLYDEKVLFKMQLIFNEYMEKTFFNCLPKVSALHEKSILSAAYYAQKRGCSLSEFFKLIGMRMAFKETSFMDICKIFYGKNVGEKTQTSDLLRKYLKKEKEYGLITKVELDTFIELLDKIIGRDTYHFRPFRNSDGVWNTQKMISIEGLFFPKQDRVSNG